MTELSFAKSFLTALDGKVTKYQQDHVFDPATFGVRVPYALPKLPHPPHPIPPKPQNDLSKSSMPAPGAEPAKTSTNTINVTLKSSRNPALTFSLPSTPPSTTIASIKQQLHDYLGGPAAVSSIDKIKILQNKKPVPASKQTISDLVDTSGKDLELGVMVMGGAPDPPPQTTSVKLGAPEPAGPGSENAAAGAETGVNPAEQATAAVGTSDVQMTESSSGKATNPPAQPGEETGSGVLHNAEFWNDLEGFLAQRLRSQEDATHLKSVFEKAWRSSIANP